MPGFVLDAVQNIQMCIMHKIVSEEQVHKIGAVCPVIAQSCPSKKLGTDFLHGFLTPGQFLAIFFTEQLR
jgi:hypothetical protein